MAVFFGRFSDIFPDQIIKGYYRTNRPEMFGEPANSEPIKKADKSEPVIDKSFRNIEWKSSLRNFKAVIRNSAGQEFRYHILPEAQRGKFTGDFKQIKPNSPMADNIIGKNEGDTFEFGGGVYRILKIEI